MAELFDIDDVKFWTSGELASAIKKTPEIFTPNLIEELKFLEF